VGYLPRLSVKRGQRSRFKCTRVYMRSPAPSFSLRGSAAQAATHQLVQVICYVLVHHKLVKGDRPILRAGRQEEIIAPSITSYIASRDQQDQLVRFRMPLPCPPRAWRRPRGSCNNSWIQKVVFESEAIDYDS